METVVSTPFQRGMFVGKTIRPKISFQTFSIPLPNLLILPVPICTIVSQAHEIIFFFFEKNCHFSYQNSVPTTEKTTNKSNLSAHAVICLKN